MVKDRGFIKDEKGQSIILVALAMVVVLGIAAFVTDVGFLFFQKRQMQNTADAAALAGARELVDGNNVYGMAEQYVLSNGLSGAEISDITVNDPYVTVDLKGSRDLFFARVLGFSSADIAARATATAGPPAGMSGLIPIGIQESVYNSLKTEEGYALITKRTSGPGNWGWVNLTGGSPDTGEMTEYIMNGYPGMVYIGQQVRTYTGANLTAPGNLKKGLSDRLDYYIANQITLYIPIIDDSYTTGESEVTIRGFAAFILTGWEGKSQSFKLEGIINPQARTNPYASEFVVGEGIDPDAPNFGLKGIALVE